MGKVIRKTESLCPECMNVIPAEYQEINGKIYLVKKCPEHGEYKVLVWSDGAQYQKWDEQSVHAANFSRRNEVKDICPYDCGLCKNHEGGVCTAVLEVTYKCNMKCEICFADTEKANYNPSLEKIREMYETARRYGGDCSIQISGGEPTVREDLPEILKMGKTMGFSHIQVNTNGLKIAEDVEYVKALKKAGADLIYLQFDGTNDEIYQTIRGKKLWEIKQKAVANCEKAEIGVILVPVIMKSVNEKDIGNLITYAQQHMPTVKGIHFQPVSFFGRYPGEEPQDDDRMNLSDIISEIEKQTKGTIKAEMLAPRKRFDPHCSFSGLFYLDEKKGLLSLNQPEKRKASTAATDFAKQTNIFTNKHWRMREHSDESDAKQTPEEIKDFLKRIQDYTLTISGMGFQDVWNIDIGRLRGCCVLVVTADKKMVPLCAFHVTSNRGERLYENK